MRHSLVVTFAAIRLQGPRFKFRPRQKLETRFLLHVHPCSSSGTTTSGTRASPKPGNSPKTWVCEESTDGCRYISRKHEWTSMAGEEEWMEKHQDMARRHERRWTPTQANAKDTRASPNSLETRLARKWGDIGHQRALNPWSSNGWMDCYSYIHQTLRCYSFICYWLRPEWHLISILLQLLLLCIWFYWCLNDLSVAAVHWCGFFIYFNFTEFVLPVHFCYQLTLKLFYNLAQWINFCAESQISDVYHWLLDSSGSQPFETQGPLISFVSRSWTTTENCAMENCQNWFICMFIFLQSK